MIVWYYGYSALQLPLSLKRNFFGNTPLAFSNFVLGNRQDNKDFMFWIVEQNRIENFTYPPKLTSPFCIFSPQSGNNGSWI